MPIRSESATLFPHQFGHEIAGEEGQAALHRVVVFIGHSTTLSSSPL